MPSENETIVLKSGEPVPASHAGAPEYDLVRWNVAGTGYVADSKGELHDTDSVPPGSVVRAMGYGDSEMIAWQNAPNFGEEVQPPGSGEGAEAPANDAATDDAVDDGSSAVAETEFDADADNDSDGLLNGEEWLLGTDQDSHDSDGDGLNDGTEIDFGSDPLVADSDGDGLNDWSEKFETGTDPNNPDSDGDGTSDDDEAWNKTDPNDPSSGGSDDDDDEDGSDGDTSETADTTGENDSDGEDDTAPAEESDQTPHPDDGRVDELAREAFLETPLGAGTTETEVDAVEAALDGGLGKGTGATSADEAAFGETPLGKGAAGDNASGIAPGNASTVDPSELDEKSQPAGLDAVEIGKADITDPPETGGFGTGDPTSGDPLGGAPVGGPPPRIDSEAEMDTSFEPVETSSESEIHDFDTGFDMDVPLAVDSPVFDDVAPLEEVDVEAFDLAE